MVIMIMKNKLFILFLVFLIGFFVNDVYSYVIKPNIELPFANNEAKEISSPADRISPDDIVIYDDFIVIKINNSSISSYEDTNSMDPFLDKEANGIEIIPANEDDVKIGDIIAYEADWADNNLVVHRVISIDEDENGRYFVTKGDNSNKVDPQFVRFGDIRYILVGVLY